MVKESWCSLFPLRFVAAYRHPVVSIHLTALGKAESWPPRDAKCSIEIEEKVVAGCGTMEFRRFCRNWSKKRSSSPPCKNVPMTRILTRPAPYRVGTNIRGRSGGKFSNTARIRRNSTLAEEQPPQGRLGRRPAQI